MQKNILITSAGRRVSLVKYFQKEAKINLGIHTKVFTTDIKPELSPACRVSDKSFYMGKFSDPEYIPQLLNICLENGIKLVIPTIDTELLLLSKNREHFSKHGIHLIVSDIDLVKQFRNKYLTNGFFQQHGINIPKIVDIETCEYPVFIKPVDGSSSQNLHIINSRENLPAFLMNKDKFIHMEYLSKKEHEEYTIDLYYDKNSTLKCVVPRLRIETRGGEVSKGLTRKNSLVPYIKERLSRIRGARGTITLQVFLNKNTREIYGIEINPRFGGGYPLSYNAGANYISWLIQEYLLGKDVPEFNDWEDNLLLLRSDNEMLIHDFEYK